MGFRAPGGEVEGPPAPSPRCILQTEREKTVVPAPRNMWSLRMGRGKRHREVKGHAHGHGWSPGLRVPSSPGCCAGWRGAGAVGACTLDCIANFLLFTVIGCAISMLTLFLFNLAFAAAAACSRAMDFYLRASWFGGKDIASLTCMGCGSLF